jgi:cytochrome c-type biogenesis protein CcmF
MILGYVLLALALGFTVAANVLFVISRRAGAENLGRYARWSAIGAAASISGASAYLVQLIATHQFQVAYVAEYSAKRSSSWYLFAAFWGGQEGSLLLWGLWTAILGAVLAFKAKSRVNRVWPIFGIAQVLLICLLLLQCPFKLGTGPVPLDGQGLNPTLENMWMVIHPPILFLGFSSTIIPWAWCLYGLIYRDWDGWAKASFPWTLFSFATLGLGLSLGGYWAYETLGWGGFWAWDPVENSSLVPWIFLTALLHGIPLQIKNGGYKVTNFLLGCLPFAFMFYGTFLTRTGILSDFSVHSFSAIEARGYYALLVGVVASITVPLAFLIARFKQIAKPPAYEQIFTREFGYFLASALLGVIGLLVAVGMSAPLITKIWMEKGAAAQAEFYNQGTYPLAIILSVAMAATPYFAWKASSFDEVGKRLRAPYFSALVLAFGVTGMAFYLGIRKPLMILQFAAAMFAVTANIALMLPRMRHRSGRHTVGGFVAHAGAGLLLAGVAGLVTFQQKQERVMLMRDEPVPALGYTLTYKGMTNHPYDREHNRLRIQVEKNGKKWEAAPHFYFAPFNNKDVAYGNPPAVVPSLYTVKDDPGQLLPWNNPVPIGDLYVALSESGIQYFDTNKGASPNRGFSLGPSAPKTVGEYTFALRTLSLDENARRKQAEAMEKDPHNQNPLKDVPEVYVQATVDVTYRGKTETVMPQMRLTPMGGVYAVPTRIPGPDGREVMLTMTDPSEQEEGAEPMRALHLRTLNAEDPTETVYVDISTKPLISLVWLGAFLYTVGGFVAYRRRAIEAGLLEMNDKTTVDVEEQVTTASTIAPAQAKRPRRRSNAE